MLPCLSRSGSNLGVKQRGSGGQLTAMEKTVEIESSELGAAAVKYRRRQSRECHLHGHSRGVRGEFPGWVCKEEGDELQLPSPTQPVDIPVGDCSWPESSWSTPPTPGTQVNMTVCCGID